jgi:2-amino-4-hydroxy-6-hydroxymethyldihydropteridine diphosphokinase
MSIAFLSLGSNLGDRWKNLERAIKELSSLGKVLKVSQFYETKPYGYFDQPDFLNAALLLETHLEPETLLHRIKEIEKNMGREDNGRWRERIIDIDIIFYDDLVIDTPRIKIPHPETPYREFVLKPLKEIAPTMIHPVLKKTVEELFKELPSIPYVDFVTAPPGNFYLSALGEKIYETSFKELKGKREANPLLLKLKEALNRYFRGEREDFSEFPLDLERLTPFQSKVYTFLREKLTYGKTITYGELAERLGVKGGARAIGNAMAKNPFPIIIPCHRVLKSGNKIGGFGGGEEWKKYLLRLEGALL